MRADGRGLPAARVAATLLVLYVAVIVWLTWPLARHAGTHLPYTWEACRFDLPQLVWSLAYQSMALVSAPWRLTEPDVFHPTPHALFYSDVNSGAVPWFLPTYLLTGNPALASNLTFLVSLSLTAWALHAVVLAWTGSHLGGVVSAWTLLTSRWLLWNWVPSVPSYAVLQYLPFVMLVVARGRSPRSAGALVALLVLQGLTTIYVALPMMLGVCTIAIVRLLRRRRGAASGVAAVGASGLVLLGAVWGWVRMMLATSPLAQQGPWTVERGRLTDLPWGLFSAETPLGVVPVVLLVITVGAVARAREASPPAGERTAWQHGAFWAVLGVWVSLTPNVRWSGRVVPLGPLTVSSWLVTLRRPDRMGVVGLMGLAVLAGLAVAACERRLRTRTARPLARYLQAAALGAVVLVMYWQYRGGAPERPPLPAAYPLTEAIAPSSPLLDVLRQGRGPVLELPATWGRDAHFDVVMNARAMYRAIFHGRPLLNGYAGYWPPTFPHRLALAARLPDPDALAELRDETGVATILVHVSDIGHVEREVCALGEQRLGPLPHCRTDFGSAERATWRVLADAGGRDDLRLVARDGDALLFRVTAAGDAASGRPDS